MNDAEPTGELIDSYARWRSSRLGRITDALEQQLLFECLGSVAGKTLLDLGCGDGALALELARRGAIVTGLDADAAIAWPAKSTVHAVLDRYGLVKRARDRKNRAAGTPLSAGATPNALWCADFKGEFKLGNGRYCYPLTAPTMPEEGGHKAARRQHPAAAAQGSMPSGANSTPKGRTKRSP